MHFNGVVLCLVFFVVVAVVVAVVVDVLVVVDVVLVSIVIVEGRTPGIHPEPPQKGKSRRLRGALSAVLYGFCMRCASFSSGGVFLFDSFSIQNAFPAHGCFDRSACYVLCPSNLLLAHCVFFRDSLWTQPTSSLQYESTNSGFAAER